MTLNGVMTVTLRYFTEFGKPALQKKICGGIYARVYRILVRVTPCTICTYLKATVTREKESIYSPWWQSARKGQCPSMLTTKQQKIQNCRCNKYLPNPVSIIVSTHSVISQYLFTSADKMKYDVRVILSVKFQMTFEYILELYLLQFRKQLVPQLTGFKMFYHCTPISKSSKPHSDLQFPM